MAQFSQLPVFNEAGQVVINEDGKVVGDAGKSAPPLETNGARTTPFKLRWPLEDTWSLSPASSCNQVSFEPQNSFIIWFDKLTNHNLYKPFDKRRVARLESRPDAVKALGSAKYQRLVLYRGIPEGYNVRSVR